MVVKEKIIIILLSVFLCLTLVSSQVIQVQESTTPEKKGFFSFLSSPIFWYIVVGLIIFVVFLVILIFIFKAIIKYIKNRQDLFWRIKSERTKLAKIQRRYDSTHFFKIEKNTPIRLVRKEGGKMIISSPIAYHRGDYSGHEGNIIIAMNLRENKKWFFFPVTSLLIVPNQEKVLIEQRDSKGERKVLIIDGLPRAKDIVQFNDREILIFAESLSNVGMFYVPVLKADDGKIVDLSLPVFRSLKDVAITEFLYEQTSDFSVIAKKTMDINPNLRFITKSQDNSSSVEIPQDNKS